MQILRLSPRVSVSILSVTCILTSHEAMFELLTLTLALQASSVNVTDGERFTSLDISLNTFVRSMRSFFITSTSPGASRNDSQNW